MTRVRLVRVLLAACAILFAACLAAQLLSSLGLTPPIGLYFTLFVAIFIVSGITGLLQFRVELIEREWPFFTYESLGTLFRRFPLWAGVIAAVSLTWHVVGPTTLGTREQGYTLLAAIFALEFGALLSLHRQPWLLENLTCPNGHQIHYYNRFCPACGALLSKIPGSA